MEWVGIVLGFIGFIVTIVAVCGALAIFIVFISNVMSRIKDKK